MVLKMQEDITKRTLYEDVADSLEQSILLYSGESVKLPTEFELAEQFGVSRTVIREALKILSERGLVKTKVGDGAYTTRLNNKYMEKVLLRVIKSNNLSDKEITEVRLILECAAARLAKENSNEEFIEKLEKKLEEMVAVKDNLQMRAQVDVDFHLLIAQQSGNMLLRLFIQSINDVLQNYIQKRLELRPQGNQEGILSHSKLVELLKNGTPEEVESLMRKHLMDSYTQI